jgi:transposase
VREDEARALLAAGDDAVVALLMAQAEQIAALRAEVEELRRRLGRNSRNSSLPPSKDPLDAPKRRAGKRSARKPGGQPGHEGHRRELVEHPDETLTYRPPCCAGCGADLDGVADDGDAYIHQVSALAERLIRVVEHRRARVRCPACGHLTLAGLPVGVTDGAFDARFEALITTLAGVYRLSREQIRMLLVEIFKVKASKGGIDKVLMRASAILADPWAELREAIRQAEVVHADETTWRLGPARQWLWVAASALVACYRIDPSRGQQAAKELLGEGFDGFLVSDRYAGYHFLDVLQQQLCWAHVSRQITEVAERTGAAGRLGRKLQKAAREIFVVHRAYLAGQHDLDWLARELAPLRARIQTLLEQGARGRDHKTANFCAGLLDEYDALWLFSEVPGIDPTNNAAERALRHGVILRKVNGGTKSDAGSRFIERILTVRETCRLQGRAAMDYLSDAFAAAHHGQPAPSLLPAGP